MSTESEKILSPDSPTPLDLSMDLPVDLPVDPPVDYRMDTPPNSPLDPQMDTHAPVDPPGDSKDILQSLRYAHDIVEDLKFFICDTIEETQDIIEDSLQMLKQAVEKGDEGKRSFPTLKADLRALQNRLDSLECTGVEAAMTIHDHLRDLREPLMVNE